MIFKAIKHPTIEYGVRISGVDLEARDLFTKVYGENCLDFTSSGSVVENLKSTIYVFKLITNLKFKLKVDLT